MARITTITDTDVDNTELLTLKQLVRNTVSLLAGSGSAGQDNGTGAAATFNNPADLALDSNGTFLYAVSTNVVRKVSDQGVVTTLAGSGITGGADGVGTLATFNTLYGICIDPNDQYLYTAEYSGHIIRRVTIADGTVLTIAGTYNTPGSDDGNGAAARFRNPIAICIDPTNTYLYVADLTNYRIRRITVAAPYTVTWFAGTSTGDVDGVGAAALFKPFGMVIDPTNTYMYFCDYASHRIKRMNLTTALVRTIAGTGAAASVDGFGLAASVNAPSNITISADGKYLYWNEQTGNAIRRMRLSTGQVTTVLASGTLSGGGGVALAPADSRLYIADTGHHKIISIA